MNPVREYCSRMPVKIRLHGGHSENDAQITLKSGNLSMILENGALRYIRMGKIEVVRMIYFALRVSNWLTIKPEITYIEQSVNNNSFKIKYKGHFKSGDVDFIADFIIEGKPDSTISFSFEGVALNSFMRNRIGLCVLHPLEGNAGRSCTVIHTDGTAEKMTFPELISPHQPFVDIKSFIWSSETGIFRLDYSGDIFETEDHRNWTDSSFKTYSTPLSIPFPVVVEKGTKILQSILLKMDGETTEDTNPDESIKITVSTDEQFIMPPVGVSRSARNMKLSPSEAAILEKVKFGHYRVELHLFEKSWKSIADEAVEESISLSCKLEFALVFDDDFLDQAADFLYWAKSKKSAIEFLLLFHKSRPVTPEDLSQKVIPLIQNVLPAVKTGTGSNANFVQLNRNRPSDFGSDFICYSVHPQEHASDNSTLVENLEAQAHTVRSAKSFSSGRGIFVSPVTIQRRFNANRNFYEAPAEENNLPPQVDTRIMSLFGACWTAGSLKHLITSGVNGITFFETAGERGIIQGDLPSRWQDDFSSIQGMIFPVYHLLKFVLGFKSFHIINSVSSDPLRTESLILSDGKNLKIVLVNFTGETQFAEMEILKVQFRFKEMNGQSYPEAVSDFNWLEKAWSFHDKPDGTISLHPYSVIFIEVSAKL